ncbi:hypothetical protein K469DRAFT_792795 [Zopfia rhizophila CBS 207.26]|uniref:Prion-inhibition and propagation HeLo domain-containing protein n=1 Tax=Zopfia rhizophila CBS 207.26 TaxID=1314779 RepID=A0A6A6DNB7_9PEZI|nr:hypothetical protein K469DRAFT_792795 [Zopfia rhizophila CBS 207.26]
METLHRISDLLKGYKELKDRYGRRLVADDPNPVLRTHLPNNSAVSSWNLKRFSWPSSDKSKLEGIVKHLEDYNDALYDTFSAMERRNLRQGLVRKLSQATNRGSSRVKAARYPSTLADSVPEADQGCYRGVETTGWQAASLSSYVHNQWRAKAICSDNVVFFNTNENTSQRAPLLQDPRLLGFEYSRPNNPTLVSNLAMSQNLEAIRYRHPNLQGAARGEVLQNFRCLCIWYYSA